MAGVTESPTHVSGTGANEPELTPTVGADVAPHEGGTPLLFPHLLLLLQHRMWWQKLLQGQNRSHLLRRWMIFFKRSPGIVLLILSLFCWVMKRSMDVIPRIFNVLSWSLWCGSSSTTMNSALQVLGHSSWLWWRWSWYKPWPCSLMECSVAKMFQSKICSPRSSKCWRLPRMFLSKPNLGWPRHLANLRKRFVGFPKPFWTLWQGPGHLPLTFGSILNNCFRQFLSFLSLGSISAQTRRT